MNGLLQLNYNNKEAEQEFRRIISGIPEGVTVYLVGGCVRNALFKEFHGQSLIQRDYDQVITSGNKPYTDYLRDHGYQEKPYPSQQDIQTVWRKPLFDRNVEETYDDWIVFDMHTVEGTSIEENIVKNVCFTINGCAILAKDALTKTWKESLIEVLPGAIQDIKSKKLRVNQQGYKFMKSNFFALLRFMSVGFTPPPDNEVKLLLDQLKEIDPLRFDRNVTKVWNYVGSEAKARELVKGLGIDIDVFDLQEVKSKL